MPAPMAVAKLVEHLAHDLGVAGLLAVATPAGSFLAAGSALSTVSTRLAERHVADRGRRRSRRGARGRSGRWRSGPGRSSIAATADSGTAAPARVGDACSDSQQLHGRCARRSSSCTRIGTCRSPTSNLARLAPMSPMVAMRTASAIGLGARRRGRPRRRLIGTTRSSGRSSSARRRRRWRSSGMRLALAASSSADRLARRAAPSRAGRRRADSSRWPLSLRNQKRMSGTLGEAAAEIVALICVLGERALGLRHQVDDERRLAHLDAEPSRRAPPLTKTLFTSGMRLRICARSCR